MSTAYLISGLAQQDRTVEGFEAVTAYEVKESMALQVTCASQDLEQAHLTAPVVDHKIVEVRDAKKNDSTARMTIAEAQLTQTSDVDPHLIAAILARIDAVHAIHVTGAEHREMHVWIVVSDLSDATLNAVFDGELTLHELLGPQRLAAVEFHVRETGRGLRTADRIYERDR